MRKRRHSVDTAAILLVACLFAISAMLSLGLGAKVYSSVSKFSDDQAELAALYISTKARATDAGGALSIVELATPEGGFVKAIRLSEVYDDELYYTYVYCYDNYLMELFCSEGSEFETDAGELVMPVSSLELNMLDDGMLYVGIAGRIEFYVGSRSAGGWSA